MLTILLSKASIHHMIRERLLDLQPKYYMEGGYYEPMVTPERQKIDFVNSLTSKEIVTALTDAEKESLKVSLVRLHSLIHNSALYKSTGIENSVRDNLFKINGNDANSNLESLPAELLMLAYSFQRYIKFSQDEIAKKQF